MPGELVFEGNIPNSWGTLISMSAELNSRQQNPRAVSRAKGMGTFLLNTEGNTLEYWVNYTALKGNETMAHIHGFALPGANADVLVGIPLGNEKHNMWLYNEDEEGKILAGLTYVNIHSTVYPQGEIRGQIEIE